MLLKLFIRTVFTTCSIAIFLATVSDKNIWNTSTEGCFFLLAHLFSLPMLFIAVNSPNFVYEEGGWEIKDSKVSQQFLLRLYVILF